jgi:hypothetical protein
MGNSSSTVIPAAATLSAAMNLGVIIRGVVLAAALGGLAAVVGLTGAHLDRAATAAARLDEPVYLPRAEYLRPISLGWQNVLADILWFRTISYFGEHYRSDRTYAWLAQMCDLVTDLDPRAEHVIPLRRLHPAMGGRSSRRRHRLLEKGARQFSRFLDARVLHRLPGLFLQERLRRVAQTSASRHAAAGVHPSVADLVAVLATEQYGPDTTLAFLSELERDIDSQDVRHLVRENMEEARLAADLQRAQHRRRGLSGQHGASAADGGGAGRRGPAARRSR